MPTSAVLTLPRPRLAAGPLMALAAVAVLALENGVSRVVGEGGRGHAAPGPRPEPALVLPPPVNPLGPRTLDVLLMGSDATGEHGRGSAWGNTDTMLLARFDLATHQVSVVSIPRDTRVPIPGHRTFKVNAANPYGGPHLAMRTVSDFLDVPVDRYVLVNLDGVIQAVDAVGGVEVTVPARVDYDDRAGHLHEHFTRGRHHFSGEQVEAYVRFRHDGGGDIGRVKRQQAFIREVTAQVFTPGNLLRAPRLWNILASHAQSDLTPGEAVALVHCLGESQVTHQLRLATLPGDSRYVDGYSYWVVDRSDARKMVKAQFAI